MKTFIFVAVVAALCVVFQFAIAEQGWNVNGYIYDPRLADFKGLPKIRVLLFSDGSPVLLSGDSVADSGGYFYIQGIAPPNRTRETQKLRIYHRSALGDCQVTTYDGEGIDHEVLSANYSVLSKSTVKASIDGMCLNDLYPAL